MDERTAGLILRLRPLTETSLIVHWLTPDCGRLATVARGARRPRSPLRGKLDLFFEGDLTFQRSRRSDLHALREVRVTEVHPALRRDWVKLRQAAYVATLVEQVTETETPVPELHRLVTEFLRGLDRHPCSATAVLAFELCMLAGEGLQPDLESARLPEGARRLAGQLVTGGGDAAPVPACPGDVRALDRFLQGFLQYHLGRLPRGRAAALDPTAA